MQLFDRAGYSRTMNVEANRLLEGRSYYYSPDTRRFFRSRVYRLAVSLDRTLLVTVERVPSGARVVVHYCDGRRLYRSPFFASMREADPHYRMITEACNGYR